MPRNGLLIEYGYCTGCHACEVACKQEHNYSEGMCGIRVDELVTVSPDKVHVNLVPAHGNDLLHFDADHAIGEVMLLLAGDLAGMATGAPFVLYQ